MLPNTALLYTGRPASLLSLRLQEVTLRVTVQIGPASICLDSHPFAHSPCTCAYVNIRAAGRSPCIELVTLTSDNFSWRFCPTPFVGQTLCCCSPSSPFYYLPPPLLPPPPLFPASHLPGVASGGPGVARGGCRCGMGCVQVRHGGDAGMTLGGCR